MTIVQIKYQSCDEINSGIDFESFIFGSYHLFAKVVFRVPLGVLAGFILKTVGYLEFVLHLRR